MNRCLSCLLLLSLACSSKGTSGTTGAGGGGPGAGGAATTGAGGTTTGAGGATTTGAGGASTGVGGSSAPSTGSVLERGNHPSRDAHFVQPRLTKANAARMVRDTGFMANFTGAMWASPLFLENGPGGKGVFIAVTTGNDVFALDETTGAVVWMRNLGSSPTMNGVNCGSIHPLGILGTPVIDATTRTIYVAAAIGTTAITRHEVHAMSADDGSERTGWPVDVSGGLNFAATAPAHNQRSALSLVGGILYVAYGGHVGDCGDYRGRVVGISTSNPTMRGGWTTGGVAEGIWAAGGMASDGNGVFAVTGNRMPRNATGAHQDSEQVVRITGLGVFTRSNQNLFFPTGWQTMDNTDADFGASSPIYLSIPGATPANYVVALAKDGHMYLLDSTNLGGSTPVVDFMVATGAMAIKTAPTAYKVGNVVRVALSTDSGATCPSGGGSGKVVMSVSLPAGAPPVPQRVWCASIGGGGSPPSPISTSTDGSTDAIVWVVNNGTLNGLDGDTGTVIYNGSGSTCSNVRQWTSPIAVKGRIVVGGDGHLCSWSVPP